MKTCCNCKIEKPVESFSISNKSKDGRQSRCKKCHSEKHERFSAMICAIKGYEGCQICGYNEHPFALQFDHIDPSLKKAGVGKMSGHKTSTILEEISKCRVLCANCHSIHTHDPKFHQNTLDLE